MISINRKEHVVVHAQFLKIVEEFMIGRREGGAVDAADADLVGEEGPLRPALAPADLHVLGAGGEEPEEGPDEAQLRGQVPLVEGGEQEGRVRVVRVRVRRMRRGRRHRRRRRCVGVGTITAVAILVEAHVMNHYSFSLRSS